mmetsp:Transcript_11093/g.40152  ORF Transcript_11093/g.40152 Transcript_11093/m.40152 type:complete len:243 (+) Transcript_11093:1003-1731(+)
MLNLNFGKQVRGVALGSERRGSGGGIRIHHLNALSELLRHEHEMVFDAVALKLITFEPDALVLVVETDSNSSTLGGIDKDSLDLGKFEEGNHLLQRLELHGLVNLRRLLQHANDSEAAHARQELVESDGWNRTRCRQHHCFEVERGEHLLSVLAKVQRVELFLEERVALTCLDGDERQDTLRDELLQQRFAREDFAWIALRIQVVPEERRHSNVTLFREFKLQVRDARRRAGFVGRNRYRGE